MASQEQYVPITGLSKYLQSRSREAESMLGGYVRDSSWVRASFIAPVMGDDEDAELAMDPVDIANMSFSSAMFKFQDTKLGGDHCINPPPQFTRYADLRMKGLMPGAQAQSSILPTGAPIGMGRRYSEMIHDHNQVIHIRFGVATFNSLTQFFTGFYNSSAGSLARTGRADLSFIEKFLKFAATVVSIAIFPLAIVPMLLIFAGDAVRFLLKIPSSKFCYLKPSMPAYWTAVSNMFNQLCVNRGLIKYVQPDTYESFIGEQVNLSEQDRTIFSQLYPEFSPKGTLDVYAVATRSKRLEIIWRDYINEQFKQKGADGWYGKVRKVYEGGGQHLQVQQANPKEGLSRYLTSAWDKWLKAPYYSLFGKTDNKDSVVEQDLRTMPDVKGKDVAEAMDIMAKTGTAPAKQSVINYFKAAADDGGEFASFRVDNPGSVSESFSNSTAPSAMKEKFNSASQEKRDLMYDLAGGNIDPFGIAQTILSGIGTVMSTAADILQVSGLAAFAGNAFIDIPDHYQDSVASLPDINYTVTLATPYNNMIAQMFHIYLPFCMLLAGVLPLATGKQSYRSPFLCEIFDRGRKVSRLAIMDSLSVTRATAHTGWTKDGNAIGIEVSFKFKDLSSVVAMPIQQGMSLFPLAGIWDMDNTYTDYMAALSGLSLGELINRGPIFRRNLDNKIANYSSIFTIGNLAMDVGQSSVGTLASIFNSGTPKK